MKTKTVLLPIEVPEGEWCRVYETGIRCVQWEAFGVCRIGLRPTKDERGYHKPKECRELKDADTDNTTDN